MRFSVDIEWNWKAFGLLFGYENSKQYTPESTFFMHITFLTIAFNWGN